jgi:iron complex transport system substrate-binding protein
MRTRPAPALLLLLAVAGCGGRAPAGPDVPGRPLRVMSVNLCTDQLVLALLPPPRIASVTWLARDPAGSVMTREAGRVAVNHGEAEEVIAQAPDLVVADSFGKPVLRAMLKRLGYPLVEVAEPGDLPAIRRATRQVAAAVGERARGEALIAAMDAAQADLARHPGLPIRVAAWNRGGIGAGPGTLEDAVLTGAGARNVAHDLPPGSGHAADVETLLVTDPALLVEAAAGAQPPPSLGDAVLRHPLVRRFWHGRVVRIPSGSVACGTPLIARAALRLREQLRGASSRAGPAVAMQGVLR